MVYPSVGEPIEAEILWPNPASKVNGPCLEDRVFKTHIEKDDCLKVKIENLPYNTPRSLSPIQAAYSKPLNRLATNSFSATLWMLTKSEFAVNDLQVSLASVHVLLWWQEREISITDLKNRVFLSIITWFYLGTLGSFEIGHLPSWFLPLRHQLVTEWAICHPSRWTQVVKNWKQLKGLLTSPTLNCLFCNNQ